MWNKIFRKKSCCLLVTLSLVTMLVSGCGALGVGSKPPQLSLADIGLESFGLLEQRLSLVLRVQNANAAAMEIRGLSYTLDVNGQRFAQGVEARPVTVPGYGEKLIKVNAIAGTGSVLRQLQALAQGGREAIDYHLQGQADVNGLGTVPFDQTGDIPLPTLLGQPAPSRRYPPQ